MKVVHKGTETELIASLGPSPSYLSPDQKKAFQQIGKFLIGSQRMKRRYMPALEIIAVNMVMWRDVVEMINTKNKEEIGSGYIQTFQNKTQNISPQMTLKEKSEDAILKCIKQFGMDPQSDKLLGAPSNQLNLFEQLQKVMNQ